MNDPTDVMVPDNILDTVVFGRLLRSIRTFHYDRATDFLSTIKVRYGIRISERSYYAIERGEQMCPLDLYEAILVELDIAPGYFLPAMRSDVAKKLSRRYKRRRDDHDDDDL